MDFATVGPMHKVAALQVSQAIPGAYWPNSNFSRGLHPTAGNKIRGRGGSRAVRTSDQVA